MGLYDRDYYREDRPGLRLPAAAHWSAVTTLIAINVAVYLVEIFTQGQMRGGSTWIEQHLALEPNLFQHPWKFWQLLSYGFVHDSSGFTHILFNMIALYVFGGDVERIYGKREFLKLYISLVILAGLVYVVIAAATKGKSPVEGASGGIMGVAVIFACHFPRRMLYIWGVLPVPAFMLVIVFIALDFLGSFDQSDLTAHTAHLGGAAFGFVYYRTGWNLFRLWPRGWSVPSIRLPGSGPKLRVHSEPDEVEEPPDDYLTTGRVQQRVDQLLEKISQTGESSLTAEERQFLADASRRYQQHRRR
ncbi:MAG TPA: rhomboid family intramembrane serine protease [Pirellulales bacterium]|jgi:membrane associated rhomboid family serine protease|nr:rhomboid family intramembrane serine protease [Pirellulales bacterium]